MFQIFNALILMHSYLHSIQRLTVKYFSKNVFLACVTSVLALSACGPDLRLAKQAYKEGYPDIALKQWIELSDFGIPQAHLELARLYSKGTVVEKDLDHSLMLIDKAIASNEGKIDRLLLQVKVTVASEFLRSKNEQHQSIGLSYLQDGINGDYPRAFFEMARAYEEGYGRRKNANEAIKYYNKAEELGYVRAIFYHGRMFERGRIVQRNNKIALDFYERAYDAGYEKASKAIVRIKR